MIACGARVGLAEGCAAAKQRREEITEVLLTTIGLEARAAARAPSGARATAGAGELEAAAEVRRRPELLSRLPVGAELVVRGALLGVLQHLVRLLHFLEARLGVWLLAYIGVVLAGQPPVGALDLIRGGGALDAQDLVVVTEFHGPLEMVAAGAWKKGF